MRAHSPERARTTGQMPLPGGWCACATAAAHVAARRPGIARHNIEQRAGTDTPIYLGRPGGGKRRGRKGLGRGGSKGQRSNTAQKRGEGRGDGGQREHGAAGTCTGRVVWARPRAADWRPHSRAASPRRHRRQCGAELRCVLCQPTGANWAPRAKQAAGAPLARPPPAAASPRRESRAPRAVRAAERTPRARADTHRGSIILVLALDSAPSVTRKFFCSWACGKDANPGNGVA